jgi:hypothetical protein
MSGGADDGLAVSLALLATLAVAAAMVGVRGEVDPAVTALVLAATVAGCARAGGRAAGVGSALMAAAAFDFFHTRPYLSLKVAGGDDVLVTLLLLVVGLVVGGLSARAEGSLAEARTAGGDAAAVRRVLGVAVKGDAEDVELAVRAELLELLALRDCSFTRGTSALPVLGPTGALPATPLRYHEEGFELPREGVAVTVDGFGVHFGYLECRPRPDIGVHPTNRRTAVALAEVLGLVLGATAAPPAAARS